METATNVATELNPIEVNEVGESSLDKEVSLVEAQAAKIVISNDEEYAVAGETATYIQTTIKKVEEYWEPMRQASYKAYQNVLNHKKEMLDPLNKSLKTLKGKISDYNLKKERERREQEEALRKLAQEEAERKLKEALEAEEKGDLAKSKNAIEEAEIYDNAAQTTVVRAEKPKAEGISVTKSWEITNIDPSKVPVQINGLEIRPVDEKAVMRLIKLYKGEISIPGIEFKETASVSVKRK